MRPKPRVFLDTSAMFAALLSETGGSRLLLKLGEAAVVQILVGPRVLAELDGIVVRKVPEVRPAVALLLDAASCEVGPMAGELQLELAGKALSYAPDAQILAEAMTVYPDYFVSLDREHFVGNPALSHLPFPVGTPGDCLAWLRRSGGPLATSA